MAHTEKHIEAGMGSQETFEQMVKDRLRHAVRVALISVLEEEVTAFIGAQPNARTQERCDQRNGHYTRHAGNDGRPDCGFARSAHPWGLPDAVVRALSSSSRRTGERHWGDVCEGSEDDESWPGHRDPDRFTSQRLNGFACLPYLGKRV